IVAGQVRHEGRGEPARGYALETEDEAPPRRVHAPIGVCGLERREAARTRQHVVVEEHDERGARDGEPLVARAAGPRPVDTEGPDAGGIAGGRRRGDPAGLIRGGAVDEDQLGGAVAVELRAERGQERGQAGGAIVGGHDDGEARSEAHGAVRTDGADRVQAFVARTYSVPIRRSSESKAGSKGRWVTSTKPAATSRSTSVSKSYA